MSMPEKDLVCPNTLCITTLTSFLNHPSNSPVSICLPARVYEQFHFLLVILHLQPPREGQFSRLSVQQRVVQSRVAGATAAAVSPGGGCDWVCRGNGMAEEFMPPWGEWVMEEWWGGRLDSYPTVLGIWCFKMVFFEFSFFFLFFLLVHLTMAWLKAYSTRGAKGILFK